MDRQGGVLLGFFGSLLRGHESSDAATTTVDVDDARRRQRQGAALIDVREPAEFRSGHAPGAKLVPLGQLSARLAEVPRDCEVLLVCHSGNRSRAAQQLLFRQGYERVLNVRGGMAAWVRAGLPVE